MRKLINKLYETQALTREELTYLIDNIKGEDFDYLISKAHEARLSVYGPNVYMRGLIELTNYCFRNCDYCGIRRDNENASRYRLTFEQVMDCADRGYALGYRTFVIQGGEDAYFTDEIMVDIISSIKAKYPDCAITLSLGERSYESYKKMYDAGADRYLLRHETATKALYESVHPNSSFENRMQCLKNLKAIGYQVGSGFLVGLPGQTTNDLVNDLLFLKEFQPHMIGIGPFIPQKDTPLRDADGGSAELTVVMLAITRLMLPRTLLPATTALSTLHPKGRELGLKAGGNVVMPNLSPSDVRDKYALYDGKKYHGQEDAQLKQAIVEKINDAGFTVDMGRGDSKHEYNAKC